MMRKYILLLTAAATLGSFVNAQCPRVDCVDKDAILSDKGGCYYATMTNNGRIDTIYTGSCPNDDP